MSAAPRYATLDGLRGVAAAVVLCYHTHVFRGSAAVAPHGYLAVDFFFLMSGFVIASAYQEKLEAGFLVADFVTQRAIRLYPVALAGICSARRGWLPNT
jgi:peptidoglycan/LPS O-acetylase OafA/YrhL